MKIENKTIQDRINWLTLNNKVKFNSLNVLQKEALLMMQPLLEIYDINYMIYNDEATNKANEHMNWEDEVYEHYVMLPASMKFCNKLTQLINKDRNVIYVGQDVCSYERKIKQRPLGGGTVIFDKGNRWITFDVPENNILVPEKLFIDVER